MNLSKMIKVFIVSAIVTICFSGCINQKKEADFSGVNAVCELATLKCYYHNVARAEMEARGVFGFLGTGYKKLWTEYSGVVEFGVDVNKVSISKPDKNGVVKVAIPDAKMTNVYLDENSMTEPLTDTGIFTEITKEEETIALAEAQDNMERTAQNNEALLSQAKERAKSLIEGYIKNVGEQLGETYTVEWVDAK